MRLTWSERFNLYAGEEEALRACVHGLADAMGYPRAALWSELGGPLPRPLHVVLCVDEARALFGPSPVRASGTAMFLRAADPERRQASAGLYAGDLEVEVSNADDWRLVGEGAMARHPQAGPCTVRLALRRLRLVDAQPTRATLKERATSVLRLL